MTDTNLNAHPNHPFMQAEDTFYGIELEVAMPQSEMVHYSPYGYSQMQGNQIDHYPKGWKATYDGTISSPFGPNTSVEIVSPKLQGFDGIVQLVQVLDDLNERGAVVNSSCGVHIHVDGSDLDIRDIKKVKQMFTIYEKIFYGVLGDKAVGRYNNSYCDPSSKWLDTEEAQDKYRALNLSNWHTYSQKKTIEFRLFSGEGHNLKPENIVTYLYMAVGLVVYARNCTRVHSLKPSATLTVLAKKFINNVLKAKCNQIVPDFEPTKGDGSMWAVLDEMIPQSTVSL